MSDSLQAAGLCKLAFEWYSRPLKSPNITRKSLFQLDYWETGRLYFLQARITPANLAGLRRNQSREGQPVMDNGVITIILVLLGAVVGWTYVLWKNTQKMHETINLTARQHNLVRHDDRARMLCRAIRILNPNVSPGVDYTIAHDSPDQDPYIAEWTSNESRPSAEEIKAALLEVSDVDHERRFAMMRQEGYPSVEEQLYAAYLARQGDNSKQLEVDEKIRRVKEEYPKGDDSCI